MQEATVCHLLRENGTGKEMLLGKRSGLFCTDIWNGPGGKMRKRETIFGCVRREVREEIKVNVNTNTAYHFATADFYHKYLSEHRLEWRVHYVRITDWKGVPQLAEGFKELKWFSLQNLPYSKMMVDQIAWLPLALDYKGSQLLEVKIWYGDKDLKVLEKGEFRFLERPAQPISHPH